MSEQEFPLVSLVQSIEETFLVEALLLPEVSCFGSDLPRLRRRLEKLAATVIGKMPLMEASRRAAPAAVRTESIEVVVDPVRPGLLWREPIALTFPVVWWAHDVVPLSEQSRGNGKDEVVTEAVTTFVPALHIAVVADDEEALRRLTARHISAALKRGGGERMLERLVRCQRARSLQVESWPCWPAFVRPRQAAREEEEHAQKEKSVLPEVGRDLAAETLPPAFGIEETVHRLADVLTGRRPRSVLLVGPSGVGKTAAVHELVRQRHHFGLGATPFWETSGARLVAGMSGFGMWEERCQRLWREAARSKAILHLGNLMELVEVGKSELHGQGVAAFFRPYLARGDLLAISECTPEQLPLLERQDPHLLEVFVPLTVEEPDLARGRQLLQMFVAAQKDVPEVSADALTTLDRLHRRYATYSAYPGRPLRFLRNLLRDRPAGQAMSPADVTAAFSRETGLPLVLLEDSVRLDLDQTRRYFAERVIGQPEAVDLVVDLLATVKAGLARPRKPIASLLFIGPTGVGKTEMAKTLAELLFGDVRRLTRLDMSEYSDALAVQRLIGSSYCEEGLLTARLREQPFSVVLLDEFEKAHPLLFDLLLQVLGEGRLTDAGGRLADFSNAVVILTSNLGAESFQRGGFGFARSGQRSAAREHFVQEVQAFLRPELFNRLDRIVAFAPLDEETTLQICHRQLDLLRRRDGIHLRSVRLDLAPEVAAHLARRGYDPRYGARPLKRTIERELLAPLAEQMSRYAGDAALDVRVRVQDERLHCAVHARVGETGRQLFAAGAGSPAADLAQRCLTFRRNVQALERCPDMQELSDALALLRHNVRRWQHRPTRTPEQLEQEAHLASLARHEEQVAQLRKLAAELEDQILIQLYGPALLSGDLAGWAADSSVVADLVELSLRPIEQKWKDTLLGLYVRRFSQPDGITLALYSERFDTLFELASAYARLADDRRASLLLWQMLPPGEGRGRDDAPQRRLVLSPRDFFSGARTLIVRVWDPDRKALESPCTVDAREGVIGLLLVLKGPGIGVYLSGEDGLHAFQRSGRLDLCLVETSGLGVERYQPPEGIARRGAIGVQTRRRLYQEGRRMVQDPLLGVDVPWPRNALAAVLDELIDRRVWQEAEKMVSP